MRCTQLYTSRVQSCLPINRARGRTRGFDKQSVLVLAFGRSSAHKHARADVHGSAVIAMPDPRLGEVCAACVILRDQHTLTLAELTEWSRDRMANFKVPRHLLIMDDFPRTPLGKVQKFKLAKEFD